MIHAHIDERYHRAFVHDPNCLTWHRHDRNDDSWQTFATLDDAEAALRGLDLTIYVCEHCGLLVNVNAGRCGEIESIDVSTILRPPLRRPAPEPTTTQVCESCGDTMLLHRGRGAPVKFCETCSGRTIKRLIAVWPQGDEPGRTRRRTQGTRRLAADENADTVHDPGRIVRTVAAITMTEQAEKDMRSAGVSRGELEEAVGSLADITTASTTGKVRVKPGKPVEIGAGRLAGDVDGRVLLATPRNGRPLIVGVVADAVASLLDPAAPEHRDLWQEDFLAPTEGGTARFPDVRWVRQG